MSEQTTMTEENKKTIIAFVVGLLVGGLLVYIFALPANGGKANPPVKPDQDQSADMAVDGNDADIDDNNAPESNTSASREETKPTETKESAQTGQGSISVDNQGAGGNVWLQGVTYPADTGWIGVRDYENGKMTGLLGVSRWNKAEGLTPNTITLLRPTVAGHTYAVVFYRDNGDKVFNLATDSQMDAAVATFVAK